MRFHSVLLGMCNNEQDQQQKKKKKKKKSEWTNERTSQMANDCDLCSCKWNKNKAIKHVALNVKCLFSLALSPFVNYVLLPQHRAAIIIKIISIWNQQVTNQRGKWLCIIYIYYILTKRLIASASANANDNVD